MNQTKKRLNIINLAISMTDIETIQLQIAKLISLKTDLSIQEIITQLKEGHYGKSQELIDLYIETPIEVILENNTKEARRIKKAQESAIINEFDLFVTGEKEEEVNGTYNEQAPQEDTVQKRKPANFDSLLSIQPDDILTDNIKIDITKRNPSPVTKTTDDTRESEEERRTTETKKVRQTIEVKSKKIQRIKAEEREESIRRVPYSKDEKSEATEEVPQEKKLKQIDTEKEKPEQKSVKEEKPEPTGSEKAEEKQAVPVSDKPLQYSTIPYIDQKFTIMQTQYPPMRQSKKEFTTVKRWLFQIKHGGYNSIKIEEIIKYIYKLAEADKLEEAAQLLLVTGATESHFAQFILARELYKGKLLQRNLPESFALIYSLAMNDNYPEAICDLAQFYEYGIGIDKDKEEAQELYKSAMDLGIKRATEHYERVKKQNAGLFSAFKK